MNHRRFQVVQGVKMLITVDLL